MKLNINTETTKKIKFCFIVGARPNFMKLAPLVKKCKKQKISFNIIHTGQHYSEFMSNVFFKSLNLPEPEYNLGICGGDPSQVVGKMMIKLPEIFKKINPEYIVVFGDISSTVAASITAKYMRYKIIHVEAGARSFNWDMPEEINRVITDRISDMRFVAEKAAIKNLEADGLKKNNYYVGNIMINNLIDLMPKIDKIKIHKIIPNIKKDYAVVTIHRNVNVDQPQKLKQVIKILKNVSKQIQIIFPIHPRTKNNLIKYDLINILESNKNIIMIEPLDYLIFIALIKNSKFVMTDSGGIQAETTYLKIPTITLRKETEWNETITIGSNVLCNLSEKEEILEQIQQILLGKFKKSKIPKYWNDKVAKRILLDILKNE